MGPLVKMCKVLEPSRRDVFDARAGVVEGTMRRFGAGGKT
jgi:hypothetical protein